MAEDWKERYLQLWRKTTQRQRYLLFGLIAAVLVIIFAGSYFYGSKPDLVPLFTNMETKDAGEVAAKLDEAKIQYEIQENKQGVTILVPSKDVHSTRLDWRRRDCRVAIRDLRYSMTASWASLSFKTRSIIFRRFRAS